MTKAQRNKVQDDSFFSPRHMHGFMAVVAVCAIVATTEVYFGMAEPWPGDVAWAQASPDANGQEVPDAPAVALR